MQSRIDLANIWDSAIRRSLKNSNFFISNESAFRTLVREGLFIIIFDGFDELCLHPQFLEGPRGIINDLLSYVEGDDENKPARILLTARETYWDSVAGNIEESERLETYRLLGFSSGQKKEYFRTYFNDPIKIDTAMRISKEIGGKLFRNTETEDVNAERLSGNPLVLNLISVALEGEDDIKIDPIHSDSSNPYKADPLNGILLGVCNREIGRQKLLINEFIQMEIFEELFRNDTHIIQKESIKMYLEIFGEMTDENVLSQQLSQFQNHFFFDHDGNGACIPRFEVLRTYFISRFLARGLLIYGQSSHRRECIEFLAKNAGVTGTTQITDWLVIQLMQHEENILTDAFRKASEILQQPEFFPIRRHAGQVLLKVVLQLFSPEIDKDKRLKCRKLANYLAIGIEDPKQEKLSGIHFFRRFGRITTRS